MIGFLVWGRVKIRIRVRVRVIGLGLCSMLVFSIGAIVAGANVVYLQM